MSIPCISFGIIVLNNEPFTRYLLRQIYAYAGQIIVVEGATPNARSIADEDGHSTDGTLEVLREFAAQEDPDDKVLIVTAEDEGHADGFWPGEKDEMSRAYASRATGDWLWQVDGDEFYCDADLKRICQLLIDSPETTTISFPGRDFWGCLQYQVDGPYMRGTRVCGQIHRLFKWGNGYQYVTHRLATVADEKGRNLREIEWVGRDAIAEMGVVLFHYSSIFPKQMMEKVRYYAALNVEERPDDATSALERWEKVSAPFHVHNVKEYPSWLERYCGRHPEQIELMWQDIESGVIDIETRDTGDVEALMQNPLFRVVRAVLRQWPSQKAIGRRGGYAVHRFMCWLAAWFDGWWSGRSCDKRE